MKLFDYIIIGVVSGLFILAFMALKKRTYGNQEENNACNGNCSLCCYKYKRQILNKPKKTC